ncbi:MAG: phosphoribosyl 1,2-cyclic phosphodiesterase [Rhodothermales bacterium]|jgi:phosphoribosyl 1,2-cyclic phosphodiesterase
MVGQKDHVVILDAGTGIRLAGEHLLNDARDIILVLSHPHWDHIQGFPFFAPLYEQGRRITLVAPDHPDWLDILMGQIDGIRFPVTSGFLSCSLEFSTDLEEALRPAAIEASQISTNHAGDGLGYCLQVGGQSIVYLTDNELLPPSAPSTTLDEFAAFCAGADLLIHDAQYVAADLPYKAGWGHSTAQQVIDLAIAASVSRVALFHHDPATTDADLANRAAAWRRQLDSRGIELVIATDGLTLNL